jgi:WD40 repeat protein
MGLCQDGTRLLTGSLDASVKLWQVCCPAAVGSATHGAAGEGLGEHAPASLVGATPVAVFQEADSAVLCVAIDSAGRLGAAGSDEGLVVIWDLHAKSVLSSSPLSNDKR